MKYFALACLAIIFLTACPEPEPITEERFESVTFSSMTEVTAENARRMIDFTGDQDAKHANNTVDISQADLLKLGNIVDIRSVKFLRAYHYNNWPDSRFYAQPTIIVAISTESRTRFFVPRAVCPPPDGSVCLDGLYFN